jgi:hypothetical protein
MGAVLEGGCALNIPCLVDVVKTRLSCLMILWLGLRMGNPCLKLLFCAYVSSLLKACAAKVYHMHT